MTAKSASKRQSVTVALALFAWLAATAWMRPLMLPDEGRYVGVAWEMLRSGDWLTPTLDGLPFFHKPPLFYWITAASMSLFGMNEWAMRAAPMVGACMGGFALYGFVRRWWSEAMARLSLVALAAQPLFYIGGQFANLDMLVAGCITVTIVLLAHTVLCLESGQAHRRALLGAYAMAGAGVLAKGLIGFALPGLVVLVWLALRRQWRSLLGLMSVPGVLVFLLITAPWFVAMQSRFDSFLDYFFVVQHFKRFAATGFNNVQPFWFYPAVLLLLSLPCVPWFSKLFSRGYFSDTHSGGLRLLMGVWIGVIVAFFSLPQSKLLGYVLPVVGPLAVLIADGLQGRDAARPLAPRLWALSVALSALVSVGVILWFTVSPRDSARELAASLRAQRQAQEPIFMLHDYHYDVPLYARLPDAVPVVYEWSDPAVFQSDNGRKELADAGQFARPKATATLIDPAAFKQSLCSHSVSWVIGRTAQVPKYPFLHAVAPSFTQFDSNLWRVDRTQPATASALACPG